MGETRYHFSMSSNSEEEFSGLTFIQDDNNDLTCEAYDALCDALDTLYLMKNLSGRLNFLEAWPIVAERIFGDELIQCDTQGTDDLERRAVLEEEAEDRRIALLEQAQEIRGNSVHKGVLQIEYVEKTVKEMGRDLALLVYSERIVNRFAPLEADAAAADVIEQPAVAAAPAVPQNPVSNIPDDIDVASLELGQPMDDMASLNKVGKTEEPDERARPKRGAFAPVEEPKPEIEPTAPEAEEKPKPSFDEYEDEFDAIKPISVGSDVPPNAKPVPPEQEEKKPDGPPMSPEESEYFRPNQWSNDGAPGSDSGTQVKEIKNDAMSGIKVSQKMTFTPSKPEGEEEEAPKSGIIPVIGGASQKPQDEE